MERFLLDLDIINSLELIIDTIKLRLSKSLAQDFFFENIKNKIPKIYLHSTNAEDSLDDGIYYVFNLPEDVKPSIKISDLYDARLHIKAFKYGEIGLWDGDDEIKADALEVLPIKSTDMELLKFLKTRAEDFLKISKKEM